MQKNKKKRVQKRKDSFVTLVGQVLQDACLTAEDVTALGTPDEDGYIQTLTQNFDHEKYLLVEGLNGMTPFRRKGVLKNVSVIQWIQREFHPDFFRKEDGMSLLHMRRDRKGRSWGNDTFVSLLATLMVAAEVAIWPYPRNEWATMKNGLPKIKFLTNEEKHLYVKNNDGSEQYSRPTDRNGFEQNFDGNGSEVHEESRTEH